jgi:TctA family transporter
MRAGKIGTTIGFRPNGGARVESFLHWKIG